MKNEIGARVYWALVGVVALAFVAAVAWGVELEAQGKTWCMDYECDRFPVELPEVGSKPCVEAVKHGRLVAGPGRHWPESAKASWERKGATVEPGFCEVE